MLHTRLTDLLNLDHPVMNAPMSNHSGGQLAAAVSLAGGLGTFGGTNDLGPEWLRQQIAHVRGQTDRPFGIGFITQLIEYDTTNIEIALEERVPVFIFSFADPDPWVSSGQGRRGRHHLPGAVTGTGQAGGRRGSRHADGPRQRGRGPYRRD